MTVVATPSSQGDALMAMVVLMIIVLLIVSGAIMAMPGLLQPFGFVDQDKIRSRAKMAFAALCISPVFVVLGSSPPHHNTVTVTPSTSLSDVMVGIFAFAVVSAWIFSAVVVALPGRFLRLGHGDHGQTRELAQMAFKLLGLCILFFILANSRNSNYNHNMSQAQPRKEIAKNFWTDIYGFDRPYDVYGQSKRFEALLAEASPADRRAMLEMESLKPKGTKRKLGLAAALKHRCDIGDMSERAYDDMMDAVFDTKHPNFVKYDRLIASPYFQIETFITYFTDLDDADDDEDL